MPNISASFCNFIRATSQDDFAVSPLLRMRAEASLLKWLIAKPLISPSANAVDNVVCSGCEEHCYMPVEHVRRHDDVIAYFVACDKRDDIGLVKLNNTEVHPYKFNILAFCNLLAESLQSLDEVTTLIPGILYKIGRCRLQGKGYTIFLTTNLDDETKIAQHPEYMQASSPVIISVDTVLKNTSLPTISLDSLVTIDMDGNLNIFCETITTMYKDDGPLDKNTFRKGGNGWTVVYLGMKTNVKHSKGMYYIKNLLQNPIKI